MLSPEFLKRYEFDWEVLEVIISGKSAIDSRTGLQIRTKEDAVSFLECYGFSADNRIEGAELFGNFQESLSFIRRYFLKPENPEGLAIEIPKKIIEVTDISQLLLLASRGAQGTTRELSLWACAVMKVMHTISHMDKDLRSHYFTDIQKQILDRFYKHIHTDENNQIYLGREARDLDRVDLLLFDSKPKKKRDSVLLKLLHKPENVAEDIFDRIGIRFVTKNKYDCLRVIKYLKDRYVIMPANIKPSRSRNTLLNIEAFQRELDRLLVEATKKNWSVGELDQQLSKFFSDTDNSEKNSKSDGDNKHTSEHYRSIQFTARQLIKLQNPLYDDIRLLKDKVKEGTSGVEITQVVEKLDLRTIQKEIRFFYPYEVQVYDEKSHIENVEGRSSHLSYKRGQIQAAMSRVMGELLGA